MPFSGCGGCSKPMPCNVTRQITGVPMMPTSYENPRIPFSSRVHSTTFHRHFCKEMFYKPFHAWLPDKRHPSRKLSEEIRGKKRVGTRAGQQSPTRQGFLPAVLSVDLFPWLAYSRSLFCIALLSRNAFLNNQDIAKRIAEPESFRPPGRRLDRRPNSASWQILLIQRLDIGDDNITHPATLLWRVGDIELQSDPVTFENGRPLVVIGACEAELSIKGQSLFHVSDQETRSNRIEGRLTLLGC